MLGDAATRRSSAICLLPLLAAQSAWGQTSLDRMAYLTRMATVVMETEVLEVGIGIEHRQAQASHREVTTTGEGHHRQRLLKAAENQRGDRVLVHRHKTATHSLSAQTVCLPDPTSHELAAHLHHHRRRQQAEPMSTHTYHLIKAVKATMTAGRHHAIETEATAIETAQDTTTQTRRHHGNIVMLTCPVVGAGHHLATRTEIVATLLHGKMQDGPGVVVLIENGASDCRTESVISIGDDCSRR